MDTESPVISIMTVDPITVKPTTVLRDAIAIFDSKSIRHLPVVNADRRLIGILSTTDCRALSDELIDGKPCVCGNGCNSSLCTCGCRAPLTVADVMSSGVVRLNPDDSLGLAADLFLSKEFHAVPVVEDNLVVGIVTSHDLLRAAFNDVLPLNFS